MGWEVIALGSLTIHSGISDPIDKLHRLKKIKDEIDKSGYCISAIIHQEDWIEIDLSGNKGIDYTFIEKICDELDNDKVIYDLALSEYAETGEGVYRGRDQL